MTGVQTCALPILAKSAFTRTVTTIVHTVTAGKIFHFTDFVVSCETAAAGATVWIAVRNAADVIQYTLLSPTFALNHTLLLGHTFGVPLEIPAGYDVVIGGSNAADGINAFVHGWEENA